MLQSHTPPILPSPARLGLTNPNSPNPNPNPSPAPTSTANPKPPPPSAAPSAATAPLRPHRLPTSSSSTLLPLLPPLPRAQSLLFHMASLATKLFEVSPNRALWLASFRGSLPSFLPPSAASPVDLPPVSSPKEVISLFTSLQTQLFAAVAELQEIVDLQKSKDNVSRDVQSRDAVLLAFAKKIREAERVLDQIAEDYSDYRKAFKRAKRDGAIEGDPNSLDLRSSLNLSDILSYAHKVSYTTFAPPEFGAGQAPLRGALPPAPQEEQMRASQLYHFAELDVGVPKKAPESKERDAEALVEAMKEPVPLTREEAPGAAVVPGTRLPINVPPGWKKGMPIELPRDLPPMPPGWKPGDPVPLPPLNNVMGAAPRGEEHRAVAAPALPVVQAPPPRVVPEVIQVRHVQLDINPDEEDYSSDYSSEVGSSDEDDDE